MGAIGEAYATLAELKTYLGLDRDNLDATLSDALDSSCREVELFSNRQFNRAETASSRIYVPSRGDGVIRVEIDDAWSVDNFQVEIDDRADGTYSTLLTPSDYLLTPYNGTRYGLPWAYEEVRITSRSVALNGRPNVRVTAKWGWPEVPLPVKQATLILAAETFMLKDTPLGVAGMDQFGMVMRVRDSRMATNKLQRYQRDRIQVG